MRMVKLCSYCLLVMILTGSSVFADIREPDPFQDSNVRDCRTDYIKSWNIFVDTVNDGILSPGDGFIDTMDNWWTPKSAATQYNYTYRSGQASQSGAPFSHAKKDAYWLDREAGALSFYMTYSQLDNSDFSDKTASNPHTYDYRWMSDQNKAMNQERNMYGNGWAMGWSVNNYDGNGGGDVAGNIKMDVFVHNGKSADTGNNTANYGTGFSNVVRSNPHIAVSDDISILAMDDASGHLIPPIYTDINGNDVGYQYNGLNDKRWGSEDAFNDIVNSMEAREYTPNQLNTTNVINAGDSPNEILANLTDGNNNPYAYQDAFLIRDPSDINAGADFNEGETDGGVIAGLNGYDAYSQSSSDDDWAEQQVIRIDIAPESLEGLTCVKFFDFGYEDASQVDPRIIIFDVVNGQLFYNGVAIPDNRLYIATVHVPEPISAVIVSLGGTVILAARKRKRNIRRV